MIQKPRGQKKQENSAWGKISRLAGKTSSNEVSLVMGSNRKRKHHHQNMYSWNVFKVMIVSARTFCKEKNEGKLKYEEESKKATKIERFESCPPPFQVKSEFSRCRGLKRPPMGLTPTVGYKTMYSSQFSLFKSFKESALLKILVKGAKSLKKVSVKFCYRWLRSLQ